MFSNNKLHDCKLLINILPKSLCIMWQQHGENNNIIYKRKEKKNDYGQPKGLLCVIRVISPVIPIAVCNSRTVCVWLLALGS